MQDVMLGIWKGLGGFDSKSSFKTWIIGITRRKIADYYRKAYNGNQMDSVDILQYDNVLYANDNIDLINEKISVHNALKILSKTERELIFLAFNAQLTYKQIEQLTGIPTGTIKSRMSSIKLKLKEELTRGGV